MKNTANYITAGRIGLALSLLFVPPLTILFYIVYLLCGLSDMADGSSKIKNYTVTVKERGKDVVFLRRIVPGCADRSYGIHVARLAGLPESLLKRADDILEGLEESDGKGYHAPSAPSSSAYTSICRSP